MIEHSKKGLIRYTISIIQVMALLVGFIKLQDSIFVYFSYFTFVGNVVIGVILLSITFKLIEEKYIIYATNFGLLILLVYSFVLVDNVYLNIIESNWPWFVLHYFTHVYLLIDFLLLNKYHEYKYIDTLKYLLVPAFYLIYAIGFTIVTGSHQYFFFRYSEIGINGVVIYIVVIAFMYLLIGNVLTFLKRTVSKK